MFEEDEIFLCLKDSKGNIRCEKASKLDEFDVSDAKKAFVVRVNGTSFDVSGLGGEALSDDEVKQLVREILNLKR